MEHVFTTSLPVLEAPPVSLELAVDDGDRQSKHEYAEIHHQ
jgi:hypothetical protein